MNKSKFDIDKLNDNQWDELLDLAHDSNKCWDMFAQDNPSLLDDQYPDGFAEWLCSSFQEYVYSGVLDKEFESFLTENTK